MDSGVKTAMAAINSSYSLILKEDGSLWAMGDNRSGELGIETGDFTATPVQIATDIEMAAAGQVHTILLKKDGSVWTSGWNYFGQLGDGTSANRNSHEKIVDNGAVCVAAGYNHTLILKNDGSVWGCGQNDYGQLGINSKDNKASLSQIYTGAVDSIAAGMNYSLFLKSGGSLDLCGCVEFYWAHTTDSFTVPITIENSGVKSMAAGMNHIIYRKDDGSVHVFGSNGDGQFATGSSDLNSNFDPIQILIGQDFENVQATGDMTAIIKSDGALFICGRNTNGMLGTGTGLQTGEAPNFDYITTPVQLIFP